MTDTPEVLTSRTEAFRGVSKEVAEFYGITVDYKDGEAVRHSYLYPHATKYRYLPKDFSRNSGFTNDHLFGMNKFNSSTSKAITIAEGEIDTASVYEMLGKKWPVVGLPGAGVSDKLIRNCYAWLNGFNKIIVATDSDDAGNKAAQKIANAFPGKVYRVRMTKHKDPNEFLASGHITDFNFAWVNAEKYVPQGIYNTLPQFKQILRDEEANVYIPYPIETLNDICKGLMQGHLTVITGPEGQGKTEIMRMFEYHILADHPTVPIAILHMEESKKTTLVSLASYMLGVNLRDPDHTVPQATIDDAIDKLTKSENLYLFEFGVDDDPLAILEKVRYFKEACGCKYIFIDPIQQLSYGKDGESTEEQTLTKISVQLERLATEFNIGIVVTAHVNDDGATRSSRMIGKSASVRLDLSRDHMNPDPDVRNVTNISVSKNRPLGPTGFGGTVKFDPASFTLKEV